MTKYELLDKLTHLNDDPEENHVNADEALLSFINDEEISEAFNKLEKWYS